MKNINIKENIVKLAKKYNLNKDIISNRFNHRFSHNNNLASSVLIFSFNMTPQFKSNINDYNEDAFSLYPDIFGFDLINNLKAKHLFFNYFTGLPYVPITIETIKVWLGREWKSTLKNLILPLLKRIKEISYFDDNPYIEHYLSTHDSRLLEFYGKFNHVNVKRAIDKCIKFNLLVRVNDFYSFNIGNKNEFGAVIPTKNIARKYVFNIEGINKVIEIADSLGIRCVNKSQITYFDDNDEVIYGKLSYDDFIKKYKLDKRNIDFGKCRIKIEKNDLPLFKEFLDKHLAEIHPEYKYYSDLRKEINKELPEDCNGVYRFNLTKRETNDGCYLITKIGLRDWNKMCLLKAHKRKKLIEDTLGVKYIDDEDDILPCEFEDKLKKLLGDKDFYEYDVSGSILKVLFLLNTGKWLKNVDLYERIVGFKIPDDTTRKLIKALILRAIFQSKAEFLRDMFLIFKDLDEDYSWVSDCVDYIYDNLNRNLGDLKKARSVFMHESNIYMEVEKWLIEEKGITPVKKYDAFIFDNSVTGLSDDKMEDKIKEIAEKYYQKWFKTENYILNAI